MGFEIAPAPSKSEMGFISPALDRNATHNKKLE